MMAEDELRQRVIRQNLEAISRHLAEAEALLNGSARGSRRLRMMLCLRHTGIMRTVLDLTRDLADGAEVTYERQAGVHELPDML